MQTCQVQPLASIALGNAAIAHVVGSVSCFVFVLGFRSAPPQALCFRPLRGLREIYNNRNAIV
jgi:hypothetical protein